MRSFLHKQCELLFEKQFYALFLVTVFTALPMTDGLALVIIALITLRSGSAEGIKLLLAGIAASVMVISNTGLSSEALTLAVISQVGVFCFACLHRASASWRITGFIALLIALTAAFLIQVLAPGYVTTQVDYLIAVLSPLEQAAHFVDMLKKASASGNLSIAYYLLGVKVLAQCVSIFSALILARYIQSRVFYPGGFKKELLHFRANSLIGLFMAVCVIGIYCRNSLAFSALPLLATYLMLAGLCLVYKLLAKNREKMVFFTLFLSLVLAPYIMLPIYVIFGCLDSLYNFRLRLFTRANKIRG